MNIAIQFWSFTLGPTGENFHSVTIEDILSNVRFLAKFNLTGRTSHKTCLNCSTIKALYIFCTRGVNIHPVVTCMLDKMHAFANPTCFNSYMTLSNFSSLYFVFFR